MSSLSAVPSLLQITIGRILCRLPSMSSNSLQIIKYTHVVCEPKYHLTELVLITYVSKLHVFLPRQDLLLLDTVPLYALSNVLNRFST